MTAPTLFVLIQLLWHPLVQGVQFQASLILCVGFIGWYLSGLRRQRERVRLQSARPKVQASYQQPSFDPVLDQHDLNATNLFKSLTSGDSSSYCACWPPLAVVLPVKGCRPHSSQNWLTQLGARYDGAVAFVFAVDAADDPAVMAITDLMTQQHQQGWTTSCLSNHAGDQQQQHGVVKSVANALCISTLAKQLKHCPHWGSSILAAWHQVPQSGSVEPRLVLLVQAGKATTCSQKIHNILHGIQVAQPLLEAWASESHHQATAAAKPRMTVGTEAVHILAMAAGETSDCSSAGSSACGAAAGAAPEHGSSSASPVAGGGYVCVLDDDVWMHPLGLMQLVDDLEAHPDLFMATGYPCDIVAAADTHRSLQDSSSSSSSSRWSRAWGHLLSYAAASYHLPLTIGFSIADRGTFVWGGAMMLRAAALQDHPPMHLWQQQQQQPVGVVPSILQVWRQGGYSDDLLLAAYCVENGLSIGIPASALYPQLLPASITFSQYWNYLRRQLFVLDTYYSSSNKVTNHSMMLLHSYGSAVFTAAAVATFLQLLLLGAVVAESCCCQLAAALGGEVPLAAADLSVLGESGWAEQLVGYVRVLLLHRCRGLQGSCNVQADFNNSTGSSSNTGTGHLMSQSPTSVAASVALSAGLCAFVASIALAQLSIRYMFRQCLLLIQELSPSSAQHVCQAPMSYVLLWAGWLLESAVLPVCVAYTYLSDWITWGGIKYRKQGGKVVQVVHPTTN